ncbi:hypothetical protein, partial [Brevundimonas naejangsanensis]
QVVKLLDELIAHIVAIGPDKPDMNTPMCRRVWREVFADLILALRAQPPAREDAQPVGWTEDMERERREADYERGFRHGKKSAFDDARPTRWGLVDASGRMLALTYETAEEAASMGRRCPTTVLTPFALYTHPAPDALRVAVEALEKIADARVFDERGEDYRRIAHPYRACRADETEQVAIKALAALQAEQKGGA